MEKNKIIPQMFDVRPVDKTGSLDWEKINSVAREKNNTQSEIKTTFRKKAENFSVTWQEQQILERKQMLEREKKISRMREEQLKKRQIEREQQMKIQEEERQRIAQEQWRYEQQQYLFYQQMREEKAQQKLAQENWEKEQAQNLLKKQIREELQKKERRELEFKKAIKREKIQNKDYFSFKDLVLSSKEFWNFSIRKTIFSFAVASFLVIVLVGGAAYISKGVGIKGRVLGVSEEGYGNLNAAMDNMLNKNFENSSLEFEQAYDNFSKASNELDDLGGFLLDSTRYIPFISKVSSGKNMVEAGKHISGAGKALNEMIRIAASFKNPLNSESENQKSLLEIFRVSDESIRIALAELKQAQENIALVNVDDLPKDKQAKFIMLKDKLPMIISSLESFTNNSYILADLLGGNGPRKYLFLFQNNNEMRATGGFIGSYGLLDISQGKIRKFFIDGIFNPDGQLRDKIVPPGPIQKMSAAWSLHDSNWFPDFTLSAKEAIGFYEKTGGPTVDGVITLTPTVLQKLLQVTGPIEMPEYDVILDSENFVEKTQYEVEVDYDKQENKPKKILSDLAPLLLDKLLNTNDIKTMSKTLKILSEGFQQKHILLYSSNVELQKIISNQGWSGEILKSGKDYVSVINTNINGYKTDAVVEESILHQVQVQADGSLVDTLTITRKHNGGNSEYEWWNKVNADYMRVYVPQGSQLISVTGQTREFDNPPLDYDALGFAIDPLVQKEEENMQIDRQTGTRTYSDGGKTVFANWVYVSPQESVTVVYKYVLPFKLFSVSSQNQKQIDSYSLIVQKQSGSIGSNFEFQFYYPANYIAKWKYPDESEQAKNVLKLKQKLDVDRFVGIVFEKEKEREENLNL